jgi:hypothetical protein
MSTLRAAAGLLLASLGLWACHPDSFTRSDRSTVACKGLEFAAVRAEAALQSPVVISSSGLESLCAHVLGYQHEVLPLFAIYAEAQQRRAPIRFLELSTLTVLSPTKVRVLVNQRVALPSGSEKAPSSGPEAAIATEVELTRFFGVWWRPRILRGHFV